MTAPTYRFRYFFDAGSGVCLWSGNDAARERFDYPVALDQLPLSENLRRRADYLCAWQATCIDWDYPSGPSPWSTEERARFVVAAAALVTDLRSALGGEFLIVDESSKHGIPPSA